MGSFSNFLKRIKDKIGFKIMTKEEYELFLRKKRMIHNSNFSMNDINTNNSSSIHHEHHEINPASGLPMVGGLDVQGNPYGTTLDSNSSYHND
jgi:hypothetical protein